MHKREVGVLMPISSLWGKNGIGSFGKAAYDFVDWLKAAKQHYWQVLPLGQTSYGDSPYQTFSIEAGNPYFIDLDILVEQGLLKPEDINEGPFDANKVNYEQMFYQRYVTLDKIDRSKIDKEALQEFDKSNAWLDEFALYMAIKADHNYRPWEEWEQDLRLAHPTALARERQRLSERIEFYKILQYLFFTQWAELKAYANKNGVKIIGDMPIYVAYDSSDVWLHPEYFYLDEDKRMIDVAGCPPDAFSDLGQLWGNPLYNWEYMEQTGYDWWLNRIASSMRLFDVLRIDHFRGFAGYYAIPYGREDAKVGEWRVGPHRKLFDKVNKVLNHPAIIAEDLGYMTDDVIELLESTGYPGMKVLQFAFGSDDKNDHLPQNYKNDNVMVYTSTHDSYTALGWYKLAPEEEKRVAHEYIGAGDYVENLIDFALDSKARIAIVPLQDYLNLDNSARINAPGTLGGNWEWRVKKSAVTKKLATRLAQLAKKHNRV